MACRGNNNSNKKARVRGVRACRFCLKAIYTGESAKRASEADLQKFCGMISLSPVRFSTIWWPFNMITILCFIQEKLPTVSKVSAFSCKNCYTQLTKYEYFKHFYEKKAMENNTIRIIDIEVIVSSAQEPVETTPQSSMQMKNTIHSRRCRICFVQLIKDDFLVTVYPAVEANDSVILAFPELMRFDVS